MLRKIRQGRPRLCEVMIYSFSRPYQQSRLCYSVASICLSSVCDVCG